MINSGSMYIDEFDLTLYRGDLIALKPNHEYLIDFRVEDVTGQFDVDILSLDSYDLEYIYNYIFNIYNFTDDIFLDLSKIETRFFLGQKTTSLKKIFEYFYYLDKSNEFLTINIFNIFVCAVFSELICQDKNIIKFLNVYRSFDIYNKIITSIFDLLYSRKFNLLNLVDIANIINISEEKLTSVLKTNNLSFDKCISYCQSIVAIRDIINRTDLKFSDIAKLNGYQSSSIFSNKIKRIYGFTPSDIRKIFNE